LIRVLVVETSAENIKPTNGVNESSGKNIKHFLDLCNIEKSQSKQFYHIIKSGCVDF